MMFGPLLAACFLFPRRFSARAARRGWAAYSFSTGLVIVASIAAAFHEWSTGSPDNFGGLFQRIAILAGWVWVALVALRILRDTRTNTPA
jgi:hypothetical protein